MSEEIVFGQAEADSSQKLGRELMSRLAICLKLATLHQLSNAALTGPVAALLETINQAISADQALSLQSVGENFFINRDLIKLDFTSFESAQTLRTILRRLGIHEISFHAAIDEAELRGFLSVFQAFYRSKEPKQIVGQKLPKMTLRILDKAEQDALGGTIDERQNVLRHYAVLSLATQEAARSLRNGKPARLAKLRRAVHALADATEKHPSLLIGISRFPTLRGQACYHAVAVASLVLLMGRRLGVSRTVLSELCMGALFHDLARAELPDPLEGGGLDLDKLAQATRKLPLSTVLRITAGGVNGDILGAMTLAQEHTQKAFGPDNPSSAARLISVACAFDLMTSASPPRLPLTPDHAIRIILDNATSRFDPRAALLLSSIVGLFPVGSVVQLSNGDTAMVLEAPADPALYDRPVVKVVRSARGPADYILDLADPDSSISIVGAVDPIEESVDVPQLLLA